MKTNLQSKIDEIRKVAENEYLEHENKAYDAGVAMGRHMEAQGAIAVIDELLQDIKKTKKE